MSETPYEAAAKLRKIVTTRAETVERRKQTVFQEQAFEVWVQVTPERFNLKCRYDNRNTATQAAARLRKKGERAIVLHRDTDAPKEREAAAEEAPMKTAPYWDGGSA